MRYVRLFILLLPFVQSFLKYFILQRSKIDFPPRRTFLHFRNFSALAGYLGTPCALSDLRAPPPHPLPSHPSEPRILRTTSPKLSKNPNLLATADNNNVSDQELVLVS